MSRIERDPERGRAAAAKLKALGATRILIRAAEQGYITQLVCKMPECFCPEELGGACYFEPVTPELSDWMPTHEHFPISKQFLKPTQHDCALKLNERDLNPVRTSGALRRVVGRQQHPSR